MLNPNFVFLALLIEFIAGLSYLLDTIKGKTHPNKVSFFLWSLAPLIAFFAQINQGVGIQSLLTLSVGITPLLILIASFLNKASYWKITKFDLICGVLSLLGLLLWGVSKDPNIAILFGILADGMAAVPVVVKSYTHPESESAYPWLAFSFAALITLATLNQWRFAEFAFPVYLVLIDLLIFILVKFRINRFKLL